MIIAVADTGPLLHLHQIGAGEILGHLGMIYVTPMVLNELRRNALDSFDEGTMPWLVFPVPEEKSLQSAHNWVRSGIVDPGEAEALAYAREIQADMFLTDDAAARTFAASLGLQSRGTLGIILYAAAMGRLERAEAWNLLLSLESGSTLWMSAKVRQAARDALARIFPG